MLSDIFAKRFIELEQKSEALPFQPNGGGMQGSNVSAEFWCSWATSAQNLIKAVFGEGSPHYQNFKELYDDCSGYDYGVRALQGLFRSAKEDFEGGYVFNVDLRVSGEVFGDFVVMAKHALSEGHKDVAVVLASAALEDTLKRFAASKGLSVTSSTMTEVVNALKSNGLVSGAQKSLLDAMPKIRNYAMHADWEKISEPDVNSIIGFVEQFLLTNFSP
ncbi:MAG TPA: DUF4145 domain-containing protein [Gammaproteobacteria bacterium]|nr:DUF4145 domain-containing protein [Gammaproteobacteria bacterium]